MKTAAESKERRVGWIGAFTLVETIIASAVMGTVLVSIYGGITAGFALTQSARENLRATQIMVEKFETIRLYTWDQINTSGFIPVTFTNYYFEGQGSTNNGFPYVGTVSITNTTLTSSYADNMKMVTIQLTWSPGNFQRTRVMSSFVARNGLQTYVY